MSYVYLPQVKPRTRSSGFPWILFLFVSFSLLVIFHWSFSLHTHVEDYNVSDDVAIAGLNGSGVRQVMLIALCVVAIEVSSGAVRIQDYVLTAQSDGSFWA